MNIGSTTKGCLFAALIFGLLGAALHLVPSLRGWYHEPYPGSGISVSLAETTEWTKTSFRVSRPGEQSVVLASQLKPLKNGKIPKTFEPEDPPNRYDPSVQYNQPFDGLLHIRVRTPDGNVLAVKRFHGRDGGVNIHGVVPTSLTSFPSKTSGSKRILRVRVEQADPDFSDVESSVLVYPPEPETGAWERIGAMGVFVFMVLFYGLAVLFLIGGSIAVVCDLMAITPRNAAESGSPERRVRGSGVRTGLLLVAGTCLVLGILCSGTWMYLDASGTSSVLFFWAMILGYFGQYGFFGGAGLFLAFWFLLYTVSGTSADRE